MAQGTEVDSLYVALGMDLSGFSKSIQQALGDLDDMAKQVRDVGRSLTQYVTLPLGALGGAALTAAGKMERFEIGLEAVMGSAEAAAAEMERLREAARNPGLAFEQAVQGSLALQSVGLSADEARAALLSMGNALAVSGKRASELGGVMTALQQIISKGTVSAEEINQLAERIPQIRTAMQEAFGTADTEAIQKMGIEAEEFVSGIVAELGKLPPAASGISNAFENLQQQGIQSLAELGEVINETFNVTGLLNAASEALRSVTEWFTNLSPPMQRALVILGGIAAAAGPVLVALGSIPTILGAMTTGFGVLAGAASAAWAAITSPVTAVVAAIAAVAGGAYLIYRNWEGVSGFFSGLWDSIVQTMQAAGGIIVTYFQGVWQQLKAFALDGMAGILEPIRRAAQAVGAEGIASSIGGLQSSLRGLVPEEAMRETEARMQELTRQLAEGMSKGVVTVASARHDIVSELVGMVRDGRDVVGGFFGQGGAFGGAGASGRFGEEAAGSGSGQHAGLERVDPTLQVSGFRSAGQRVRDELEEATGVGVGAFGLEGLEGLSEKADELREKLRGIGGVIREYTGAAATRFVEDFSFGVGDIIGDLIVWQDEIKSIGDAFVAFGDVAKRAIQRLIADLTTAVTRALALRAIASLFGVGGGVGASLGTLIGQGFGLGQNAAVAGAAKMANTGGVAAARAPGVGAKAHARRPGIPRTIELVARGNQLYAALHLDDIITDASGHVG